MLGLNCSPRERSNSGTLLSHCKEHLERKYRSEVDFRILNLRDLRIHACRACDVCGKSKTTGEFIPCVLNEEDNARHALDALLWADGIAVATPVHFGLPSDLFLKFITRTRVLRHQNFALADRVFGVLTVASRRSGGGETAIVAAWLPFVRHNCIPVGNGDLTGQFGTMAWAGPREAVSADRWGLEQARATSERIYWVARIVKAGKEALSDRPALTFCYDSGTK
jgi:multimeric flavodoxin WrbA